MKSLIFNNRKSLKITDYQQGVTLIEALVTLLVLSVGALGIASMQLAGLKYASGSYGRTQAVILADDMANRLKSNREFALNIDGDGAVVGPTPYLLANFGAATPALTVDCLTAVCTPTELRDYDINVWRNELARLLPSGRGSITTVDRNVMGANGGTVTQRVFNIAVEWRQVSSGTSNTSADAASADAAANFDSDDELQNFTFRILL